MCKTFINLEVKVYSIMFLPQMPVQKFGAFPRTGNFNSADFTCWLSVHLDDSVCIFWVSEMLPHRLEDISRWAKVQQWSGILCLSRSLVIIIVTAQL